MLRLLALSVLLIAALVAASCQERGTAYGPGDSNWFCYNGWAYAEDPVSSGNGRGTWPIWDADGRPMPCERWKQLERARRHP